MNPIEKEVADLEYCEGLDPKVWGETVFVWSKTKDRYGGKGSRGIVILRSDIENHDNGRVDFYPAPTFAEVWAKLPSSIVFGGQPHFLEIIKSISGLCNADYYCIDYDSYLSKNKHNKKPVNSAIKLFKWCEENGYV